MPRRVLPSGAKKRKVAKEKKQSTDAVLAKIPKLNYFFEPNTRTPEIHTGHSTETNDRHDQELTKATCSNSLDDECEDNGPESSHTRHSTETNDRHDQELTKATCSNSLDDECEDNGQESSHTRHSTETNDQHFQKSTVFFECEDSGPSRLEGGDNERLQFTEYGGPSKRKGNAEQCQALDRLGECQSTDPAKWFPIKSVSVDYWLNQGLETCQNKSESDDYQKSSRYYTPSHAKPNGHFRFFKNSMFYGCWPNGTVHHRKWMSYSASKGSIYCLYCTLMGSKMDKFSHTDGFCDWKKAQEKIKRHEESDAHRNCILQARERNAKSGHVDSYLERQFMERKQYWCEVLRRVVAVVKLLAERGLAFRGSDETIGSKYNGNFLGCIELIAQFDPFLAKHIQDFGNSGRGNTGYLSSTIVEEFIEVIAKQVTNHIVKEMSLCKYFSVSVDSTPDITHADQLSVTVRYVLDGIPVERFLSFLRIQSHKAADLTNDLLEYLKSENINIMDCRGQTYDNASNMAGKYSGMQARIKEYNPLAVFVPCTAHSLNLVGSNAVDCCVEAVSFFGFLSSVYQFFSASTYRWSVLLKHLGKQGLTVKNLSETRWSARADATAALTKGYKNIQEALDEIADDNQQTATTRHEADTLSQTMDMLEIAFMCNLWNTILSRFNTTSKSLQSTTIDLKVAIELLESLGHFLDSLRESFDNFEREAKAACGRSDYKVTRTRRRKINVDSVESEETVLCSREKFRVETYLRIIDCLKMALNYRIAAYTIISDRFRVVLSSCRMADREIMEEATKLAEHYPQDIDKEVYPQEMVQFVQFAKGRSCHTPSSQAKLMYEEKIEDVFPNVSVSLRMYLCLMVTNCSGERSFSKLTLIKNKLRSTMRDERLKALTLLSIESELMRGICFETIIENFAQAKARKHNL